MVDKFRIYIPIMLMLISIYSGNVYSQSAIKDVVNLDTYDLGTLSGAEYSPDGEWLISYGGRGLIVRDSATGDVQRIIESTESISDISISPDSRFIASNGVNNTVVIYELASGTLIHSLEGHTKGVTSVSYSPDGRFIASGSSDDTVKIWDAQNASLIHSVKAHTFTVSSVSYSPDGRFIASASMNGTVRIWNAQNASIIHSLEGHTNSVFSVSYSPDGNFIASGSRDNTIKIWNAQNASLIHTLEASWVRSVSYSPDGRFIASASGDNTVKIWNAQNASIIHSLDGHTGDVTSVSYSPNGRFIASTSGSTSDNGYDGFDNTVKIWNTQNASIIHSLEGHSRPVSSVTYSPDGNFIASGSRDNTIKIWNAQNASIIHSLEGHSDWVLSVSYSPDGRFIASGGRDFTVKIWNAQNTSLIHTLEGYGGSVTSVSYSPDGRFIASGSSDKTVKVWDVENASLIHSFDGHTSSVHSVIYSPDGRFIASGSSDKTVKVWDVENTSLIHSFEGHTDYVYSVSYSPDGRYIASGSWDDTVKIWNTYNGSLIHTLEGHSDSVFSVSYSPDGRYLTSGSGSFFLDSDNTIKVWDAQNASVIHSLKGHSNNVHSISYSPDGRAITSGSDDGTLKTWGLPNRDVVFCDNCGNLQPRVVTPSIFIHSPTAGSSISHPSLSIALTLDDGGETPEFDVRIADQQLAIISSKGLRAASDGSKNVSLNVVLPEQYRGQTINLSVEAGNSAGSTSQDVSFSFLDIQEESNKYALIIGNATYPSRLALSNPHNDAQKLSEVFNTLGFVVTLHLDITSKADFFTKVSAFAQKTSPGDLVVIYFSGHGAQISDTSYLLPLDVSMASVAALQETAITSDYLINEMQLAGAGTTILILDACRDLPSDLPAVTKGANSGLTRGLSATRDSPENTFIAYAAASGEVAYDRIPDCQGNCDLSPYVTHLSQELLVENQNIASLFAQVQINVYRDTGGEQRPETVNKVYENICLNGTCN